MTTILGISALYHDSAAALVVDGEIIAAAQEERFSRIKHDSSFPEKAIAYCLERGGLTPEEVDYVGFYEKPLLKFERLLESYLAYAPRGFDSFRLAMSKWLPGRLNMRKHLRQELGRYQRNPFIFIEHHLAHAASAFYPSPFAHSAILTLDGVGEWATASYGSGKGSKIELTHETRFPHSLGLLYSAFTYFCGFRVNDGEYKLMGLAPYGSPRYYQTILDNIADVRPDGSLHLNMEYFSYPYALRMTSRLFDKLFEGPPRQGGSTLTQREMDLAASVQKVLELAVLSAARHVMNETGSNTLCMSGGVALNCVANGKILREGISENLWIQPAADDAGGALGSALAIWHQVLGNGRPNPERDSQKGTLLGPSYGIQEIIEFLKGKHASFTILGSDEELVQTTAELLSEGKVVGWFQGRMEFGPRALGSRSILADPRPATMREHINRDVKRRESFRPFAASILLEHCPEYFDLPQSAAGPYMMLVAPVSPALRIPEKPITDYPGLSQLNNLRSKIQSVTHVDHSCRIQTVDSHSNPLFRKLLEAFHEKTGCPMLLNTSFNTATEPIVCSLEDAWNTFHQTGLDAMAIGRALILKT